MWRPLHLVAQLGIPVGPTALWRVVEHVPDGPDHVDVTAILSRLWRRKQEFCIVGMKYLAVAPDEHIQRRHLIAFFVFALVISVVGIGGGREQTQVLPSATAGKFADPFNG